MLYGSLKVESVQSFLCSSSKHSVSWRRDSHKKIEGVSMEMPSESDRPVVAETYLLFKAEVIETGSK